VNCINHVSGCTQNAPFRGKKIQKFSGEGHSLLPRPLPHWWGDTPSPNPTLSASAAPQYSRTRAFGAWPAPKTKVLDPPVSQREHKRKERQLNIFLVTDFRACELERSGSGRERTREQSGSDRNFRSPLTPSVTPAHRSAPAPWPSRSCSAPAHSIFGPAPHRGVSIRVAMVGHGQKKHRAPHGSVYNM